MDKVDGPLKDEIIKKMGSVENLQKAVELLNTPNMVNIIQEKTEEGTYEYYDEEEASKEKQQSTVNNSKENIKLNEEEGEYYDEEEGSKSSPS